MIERESMLSANARLKQVALPPGWGQHVLRAGNDEVTVLQATHPSDVLHVPLEKAGSVEIHLGVFRPKGVGSAMEVRLASDPHWRKVQPMRFVDDPGGGLQDGVFGVRNVAPGEELLVRALPGCCAALAYVHGEPKTPEAPARHQENVGAVIDVNMAYSQFRIDEPDDILGVIAPFAESDFDRICWGTGAGSFRATYFSKVIPPFGEGQTEFSCEQAKAGADVMAMFRRRGVDPLKLVVDFAHDVGLQLWADDRICHAFDPSDTRHVHLSSNFLVENQHMRAMTMEGDKHHQAMLSLAYPEFRDLKVRSLAEQARYGVDGIYIDFTRKSPIIGWEPPVLDTFKATHGKDPHALPEAEWVDDWMAHQAGFVTQFMRELRATLDVVATETGRPIPVAAQVPAGWRFYRNVAECYANGLDVATWAAEGLVDIVAPADDLWWRPIFLDHFPAMVAGTGCELWGCLHQRAPECYPSRHDPDDGNVYAEAHVDPMLILRSAADLYHQGAAGIFLWEAGELPTVLPRWDVLKHLGDREAMTDMFGPAIGGIDGRQRFGTISLE